MKKLLVTVSLFAAFSGSAFANNNCTTSDGQKGTWYILQQQITECTSPTSCVIVQPQIVVCRPKRGV